MKPEFQKVINLFEELQVAGESVSLTILSREGKSTIKLQLESPPSLISCPTRSKVSQKRGTAMYYLGDRQVSCSQSTKTDVRNVINKVTSMQDDPEKIVEAIEKGFQKHK